MNVYIQQPVIPSYRCDFFNALYTKNEFQFEVHASKLIDGMPNTTSQSFNFKYQEHECKQYFNKNLYKQLKLEIPNYFNKGDVLIYNSNPRFISNYSLVTQAIKKSMKVIAWNHLRSSTSSNSTVLLRKLLDRRADIFLVYTRQEFESISSKKSKSRFYYLNNTINEKEIIRTVNTLTGYKLIEKARNFYKRNDPKNTLQLLFCGRLTDKSRLDILLAAIKNVTRPIKLNIIGEGPLYNRYCQLCHNLPNNIEVNWLGAVYEEESLAPLFLSSDLFVYPGAIGLSINHSFAYGLPVLTHDSIQNHMPEFSYLAPGINGLLYQFENVESLTEVLEKISKNILIKLSIGSINTIYSDITFEAMLNNFINCIKSV